MGSASRPLSIIAVWFFFLRALDKMKWPTTNECVDFIASVCVSVLFGHTRSKPARSKQCVVARRVRLTTTFANIYARTRACCCCLHFLCVCACVCCVERFGILFCAGDSLHLCMYYACLTGVADRQFVIAEILCVCVFLLAKALAFNDPTERPGGWIACAMSTMRAAAVGGSFTGIDWY